mgnify:CR=1 FL=1
MAEQENQQYIAEETFELPSDGRMVLRTENLVKKYGKRTVVSHVSINVKQGEIVGLLGPNGAGKSTTILMMLGLTEPTSGTVEICGINSTTHPIEVKRKIGYLPEDVGFYDDMTGPENLIYTARLNGISDKEAKTKAMELMKRVGLEDQLAKKTGKYSRGMRQRLGLADVLIKNPEIIILDEPTSGIDPAGVQEFIELIRWLSKEEGLTVLFSSHHLDQVQKVCDRVGLFSNGQLLALIDMAVQCIAYDTHGLYREVGASGFDAAHIGSFHVAAVCEFLYSHLFFFP